VPAGPPTLLLQRPFCPAVQSESLLHSQRAPPAAASGIPQEVEACGVSGARCCGHAEALAR
jgi:hypothetical protein